MAVMSYADYELCPGCDRKALYMGERETPDGIEVWHSSCRAEQQDAALAPVYAWLVNVVGFPYDVTFGDKPEWLDLRRIAAEWHNLQATPGETVDDWVRTILTETGWTP